MTVYDRGAVTGEDDLLNSEEKVVLLIIQAVHIHPKAEARAILANGDVRFANETCRSIVFFLGIMTVRY